MLGLKVHQYAWQILLCEAEGMFGSRWKASLPQGQAPHLESVKLDGELFDGMEDHTHIPEDRAGTLTPSDSPVVWRLCWPRREAGTL